MRSWQRLRSGGDAIRAYSRPLALLGAASASALVVLWLLAPSAHAAIITVGPSGADYSTLQAAIDHASPGDVIRVATGTYTENLDLSAMGSAIAGGPGDLALVAADGPGTAVLAGGGVKVGETGSFGGSLTIDGIAFNSNDASAIRLTDFTSITIANSTFGPVGNGVSFPTDPTADNALELSRTSGSGFITITNDTFHNITDAAIAVTIAGTANYTTTVSDTTITDSGTSSIHTKRAITLDSKDSGTASFTLVRNTISGIGTTGTQVIAATAAATSVMNAYVTSNTLTTITTTQPGVAVAAAGSATVHATVADNTISDLSAAAGIRLSGVSTAAIDGRILRNSLTNIGNAFPNHGISVDLPTGTNGTGHFRIEGNTVNGCGGSAIKLRLLATSTGEVVAQDNTLQNCATDTSQTNAAFYAQVGTGSTDAASLTLSLVSNSVDGKNFRLENGASNTGSFKLEGNNSQTAEQNVDTGNTNGAGTAQIIGSISIVATGTVTPLSENHVPTAVDDPTAASEDTTTSIAVLSNDSDTDGSSDPRQLASFDPISRHGGSISRDTNGTPTDRTDDKLLYTPPAGFVGSDTFFYVTNDAGAASDVAKVTVTVSTPPTTPTIASTAPEPTNATPIPVTVTFSRPVTGFTASDITAGNASVSNFSGSGASYSFDLTPTADGSVTADIAADVAIDGDGNGNTAATQFTRTFDSTRPTIQLTSLAPATTKASPIHVSATFSEAVTGFASTDITVANAAISNFTGSGASYSFDLTPAVDGTVTADVAANAARDAAGNGNSAAAQLRREYDATAPTVSINQAASQADPTGTTPISFTVTFSENVTGFESADVLVNGSAGASTAVVTGSGDTYSVAVSGMTGPGTVTATVPAGSAIDAAGNESTASTSTDNVVTFVVNVAPTIAVAPGGICTSDSTGTMNIALTDPDTASSALTVTPASSNSQLLPLRNITISGSGLARQVAFRPLSGRSGVAVVTLTVSDGQTSTQTTIDLIVGTNNNDTLIGSGGADLILGLNGRDVVSGLGGIDLICAGLGNDAINAGDAADTIDGGSGADSLNGGNGDDTLRGSQGDDSLTGGPGADVFSGGPGFDTATDLNVAEGDTKDSTTP